MKTSSVALPDPSDSSNLFTILSILCFGIGPVLFPVAPNLITPLGGLFILSLAVTVVRRYGWAGLTPGDRATSILLCALLAWIAASTAWSIDPDRSLSRLAPVFAMIAALFVALSQGGGLILSAHDRVIIRSVLLGGSIALIVVSADLVSSMTLTNTMADRFGGETPRMPWSYNRGLSFVSGFALVVGVWFLLNDQKWRGVFLVAIAALAISLGVSYSAKLAGISALLVLGAATAIGRPVLVFVVGTVGLVALVQPFILANGADRFLVDNAIFPATMAVGARIEIWDYVAVAVLDRPWLGWGLDVTRLLPSFEARLPAFTIMEDISTHAHNNALELWNNLGIIGLLIPLALLARMAMILCRQATVAHGRAALTLGTVAATWLLSLSFLAYGIWQSTWLAHIVLVVILFRTLAGTHPASAPGQRPGTMAP